MHYVETKKIDAFSLRTQTHTEFPQIDIFSSKSWAFQIAISALNQIWFLLKLFDKIFTRIFPLKLRRTQIDFSCYFAGWSSCWYEGTFVSELTWNFFFFFAVDFLGLFWWFFFFFLLRFSQRDWTIYSIWRDLCNQNRYNFLSKL